ncbi:MAG: helix-turn-helix domain-containing protein [Acidimicrobiales bacterium]|nr:helix-turn-helix domain-containing protein [Acidimicrobiales bacterium]
MTQSYNLKILSVPEAIAQLRIGRTMFYKLVKDKKIRLIKIGSRSFILKREIDNFISSLMPSVLSEEHRTIHGLEVV